MVVGGGWLGGWLVGWGGGGVVDTDCQNTADNIHSYG